MKNIILKTSFAITLVLFILLGCCASDTMSTPLIILALLCGSYLVIFSIINRDRWIFKSEECEYYD